MNRRVKFVLSVCTSVLLSMGASLAAASDIQEPTQAAYPSGDFSATYQLTHIASGTLLEVVRIQVGSEGLLIQQMLDSSGGTIVFNGVSDQLWLVDRQRRVFHEVPIAVSLLDGTRNPDRPNKSGNALIEEAPAELDQLSDIAPYIQFEPCLHMDGVQTSQVMIHGSKLQLWQCSWLGQLIETQWYDAEHALVVRSVAEDGYQSDLINIQRIRYSSEHFVPPANYRSVSVRELMQKAETIVPYKEVDNDNAIIAEPTISMNGFANQTFPFKQQD